MRYSLSVSVSLFTLIVFATLRIFVADIYAEEQLAIAGKIKTEKKFDIMSWKATLMKGFIVKDCIFIGPGNECDDIKNWYGERSLLLTPQEKSLIDFLENDDSRTPDWKKKKMQEDKEREAKKIPQWKKDKEKKKRERKEAQTPQWKKKKMQEKKREENEKGGFDVMLNRREYYDEKIFYYASIEVKTGFEIRFFGDRNFPRLLWLNIGSRIFDKPAAVYVGEGAKLDVYRVELPTKTGKGVDALLRMEGGELKTQTCRPVKKMESGVDQDIFGHFHDALIEIGCGASYSGKATFEICGGAVSGIIQVGSHLPNTNTGTLRVVGHLPTITAPKPCSQNENAVFLVRPFGALEFVLDAGGVASLNFQNIDARLEDGACVRVDGAAYRGELPKEWTLLTARRLKRGEIRIECANFKDADAQVDFADNKMILRVRPKPAADGGH